MAFTFKPAKLALTTTSTTVYTCPSATTAIVTMALVVNVDGVNDADVSASWIDSSDSNKETKIAHNMTVKFGSSLDLIPKTLNLEAGDSFKAKASADNDLEITLSILERT